MIIKGEWKHLGDGIIAAEDKQIASVLPKDRQDNANLIAAAPEMYQALKSVYTSAHDGCITLNDREWFNLLKALRKAEGKS